MTYRKNQFLDRDHPAHIRFDIHEQGWEATECFLCGQLFEGEETYYNDFIDETICFECSAEWDSKHCVQCGCEMPLDASGLKDGDICPQCAEEEGV